MGSKLDLTGQRFGRLTATEHIGRNIGKHSLWKCLCDCGHDCIVSINHLRDGHTQSCGCLRKELATKRATKHGLSHTSRYKAFKSRERREQKNLLDTEFTLEMETFVRDTYPFCMLCEKTREENFKQYIEDLHLDHIRPLCKGFGLKIDNVAVLCTSCNGIKWGKDLNLIPKDIAQKLLHYSFHVKMLWGNKKWGVPIP